MSPLGTSNLDYNESNQSEFEKPLIALVYDKGKFRLADSSSITLSPLGRIDAFIEILIELSLCFNESLQEAITPAKNQAIKFLDLAKPDELGNSRSIWVGPQGKLPVSSDWGDFFLDLTTTLVEFQKQFWNSTLGSPPIILTKEEYHQAELLQQLFTEDPSAEEAQKEVEPDWVEIPKAYLERLEGRSDERGEKIAILQKKISNLKTEVTRLRNKNAKISPKKPATERIKQNGSDYHDQVKMRHNDQHEIDSLTTALILRLLGSRASHRRK